MFRSHTLTDRSDPSWLPRSCSGPFPHRQQNSPHPQSERSCSIPPRGFALFDQESRCCEKTSREKPQRSGLQVPIDSYRGPNPPIGSLLQDEANFASHLAIPVLNCVRSRCINEKRKKMFKKRRGGRRRGSYKCCTISLYPWYTCPLICSNFFVSLTLKMPILTLRWHRSNP